MSNTVLALSLVIEDVRQRFIDEGTQCNVSFGRREKSKQINQGPGRANRVVFEPSVDGKLGKYDAARYPGRNPRPLRTLKEWCTVYCWGWDGTKANDELAHYTQARLIHDAVIRAIYLSVQSGHGTFQLSDPMILVDKVEKVFGCELKFTLEVSAMIPDEPLDQVDDASAEEGAYINTDDPTDETKDELDP